MTNKRNLINLLLYLFLSVFGCFLVISLPFDYIGLIVYSFLTILLIIYSKFEVDNPLLWYNAINYLYVIGYVVMHYLGYAKTSYSSINIVVSIFSQASFNIMFILFNDKKEYKFQNDYLDSKKIKYLILLINIFLTIVVVLSSRMSFSRKGDLVSSANILLRIGFIISRIQTFNIIAYLLKNKKGIFNRTLILAIAILVSFSFVTAERDIIFRLIASLGIALFINRSISKKSLIYLVPFGIIFMIIMTKFKYFFITGEIISRGDNSSFLFNFLQTDFAVAGENLQLILNLDGSKSMFGLKLLAIDVFSQVLPGIRFFSVAQWFNDYFYPRSYSRAFTLIGEGYLIAGNLGVILIFVILGVLVFSFYNKSTKNVLFCAAYIYLSVTVMSSFRSTLSALFSQLIKVVIPGALMMTLFCKQNRDISH